MDCNLQTTVFSSSDDSDTTGLPAIGKRHSKSRNNNNNRVANNMASAVDDRNNVVSGGDVEPSTLLNSASIFSDLTEAMSALESRSSSRNEEDDDNDDNQKAYPGFYDTEPVPFLPNIVESQPLRQKALPHQQLSPHSQPELQIQSPPEAEGNYLGSTLMATVQFTMSLIPGL